VSAGKQTGEVQSILNDLNEQAGRIHGELQASGAVTYSSPNVEKMDAQDRREIGRYLCKQSGLDYSSSIRVIKQIGMVYDVQNDRYLVNDVLLEKEELEDGFSYISHESGHRYGRKLIQNRLLPIEESRKVDRDEFDDLVDYLISENFAERVKLGLGERFGVDVKYDDRFIDETPEGYLQRDRIGPDRFVNSQRDESLGDLLLWVDETIRELRN